MTLLGNGAVLLHCACGSSVGRKLRLQVPKIEGDSHGTVQYLVQEHIDQLPVERRSLQLVNLQTVANSTPTHRRGCKRGHGQYTRLGTARRRGRSASRSARFSLCDAACAATVSHASIWC